MHLINSLCSGKDLLHIAEMKKDDLDYVIEALQKRDEILINDSKISAIGGSVSSDGAELSSEEPDRIPDSDSETTDKATEKLDIKE